MSKNRYFDFKSKTMKGSLRFLFIIFIITACQTDQDIENPIIRFPVAVSFSFNGDISLDEETPIGGKTQGDLGTVYGVTINKKIDGNELFYTEGVFNSLDNIKVDLFSDESYVIYFSALQDGTSDGLAYTNSEKGISFDRLFNESELLLGNKFEDKNLFYLQSNSIASFKEDGSIDNTGGNALVDRFDGKVEVVNPDEGDSIISIGMRRTSFGLAFRADNLDDNDTLKITLYSAAGSPFYYFLNFTDPEDYQIRTLGDNGFEIADDKVVTLYSSFLLKIYDDSDVFVREKLLSTQDIIGKRNTKRTYVLDINDFADGSSGRNGFGLEYKDQNLIDEGEIIIGG